MSKQMKTSKSNTFVFIKRLTWRKNFYWRVGKKYEKVLLEINTQPKHVLWVHIDRMVKHKLKMDSDTTVNWYIDWNAKCLKTGDGNSIQYHYYTLLVLC